MKKLFLFAAVMFSSISFSSCSEDGNKESQTSQKLLKQIEEISADKTIYYDFSYDDQQRLRKLASMVVISMVMSILLIPIQTTVSALNITAAADLIMTLHLFLIITVMSPNSMLMARPAGDMNTKTVMCPKNRIIIVLLLPIFGLIVGRTVI